MTSLTPIVLVKRRLGLATLYVHTAELHCIAENTYRSLCSMKSVVVDVVRVNVMLRGDKLPGHIKGGKQPSCSPKPPTVIYAGLSAGSVFRIVRDRPIQPMQQDIHMLCIRRDDNIYEICHTA